MQHHRRGLLTKHSFLASIIALGLVGAAAPLASGCGDDATNDAGSSGKPNGEGGNGNNEGGTFDGPPGSVPPIFGEPESLASLNTEGTEAAARFSDDELTVLISAGEGDMYFVERSSLDGAFGGPRSVGTANEAASAETHGMLSADGLTMVFDSDRTGGTGGRDLWFVTRATTTAQFGVAAQIEGVNGTFDEGEPYLAAKNLYYSSAPDDTSPFRIKVAAESGGKFGTSKVVDLGTSTGDRHPVLTPDELEIFFSSARPGSKGEAIWRATRTSASANFGTPVIVAELDSEGIDVPTWISPDGKRLYFVSDRTGSLDIFVVTRL